MDDELIEHHVRRLIQESFKPIEDLCEKFAIGIEELGDTPELQRLTKEIDTFLRTKSPKLHITLGALLMLILFCVCQRGYLMEGESLDGSPEL